MNIVDITDEKVQSRLIHIVVMYDIVPDKRRREISKILESYGVRVQKSAFEINCSKTQLKQIKTKLEKNLTETDNIRIYELEKDANITSWGGNIIVDKKNIII